MRTVKLAVSTLLVSAALAGSAWAQNDLEFLMQPVPPNVMILMDNSGSMAQVIWDEDYNPEVFYDFGTVATACTIGAVPAIAGSEGFCPGSLDPTDPAYDADPNNDPCPDNETSYLTNATTFQCTKTSIPAGCSAKPQNFGCSTSGSNLRFTVPDYTPSGSRTRWSRNYLSWLFAQVIAGSTPTIPTKDRLETAKEAMLELVDLINPDGFNETVRFGLSDFKSGTDPDGGIIDAPVSTGNKNSLESKIVNLQPIAWTPLSETLVDIGQYMSGNNRVGSCAANDNISASNPMDEWCRKNFVIIMTDGEPTKDDHNHPDKDDFTCAIEDKCGETSCIGDVDGDGTEDPTSDLNGDGIGDRTDAPPYQNLGTDYLDDVSHKFYNTDLRPDQPNIQNIITYTIGFAIDHPLLRETADNSTGFYYVANNADELAAALREAVYDIIERATSFTAATVPSSRTSFANGFYVAWFIPKVDDPFWEGHLEAYRLSPQLDILDRDGNLATDATGTFVEPKKPFWDLKERLLDSGHPARSLLTRKGGVRTDFTTANMNAADLGVAVTDLLLYPNDPNSPFLTTEALADAIVDYVYGKDAFDQDRDTSKTEKREYILGDIFHSNPIVIGPPPLALNGEQGYGPFNQTGTFLDLYKHRDRILYAGGNDWMLHAVDAGSHNSGDDPSTPETENGYYDAGNGNELFGYVPGLLLDTVKYMPRNSPRSYYGVDGSPSAADIWIPSSSTDTSKSTSEWATALVSGFRQGGDGYFALDVTDPTATAGAHGPYPKLLWEQDDPNQPFGESWSEPIITRVKVRATSGSGDHCGPSDGDGDCREQWVVFVGGGFRAAGDPNLAPYLPDPNSVLWSDDSKAIFMLAADTGEVLARLDYDPNDPQLEDMVYALPSTPAVLDLDFDGFADSLFIGDTGGQLWKWDIHAVGDLGDADGRVDEWPYGVFFRTDATTVSSGKLHYRSIFFPLSAAFIEGRLTLAFATGERTDLDYEGDASADDNNRFYVIEDPNPTGSLSIPDPAFTEADLSDITGLPADPDPSDLGFFFVAEDGEKFVTTHIVFAGFVITTSYKPAEGSEDNICLQGGTAYLYVFDMLDGGGFFDDPAATNEGRRLYLGAGVPADPRISVSAEGGVVKIFAQTSSGQVIDIDAPDPGIEPVEQVFWKQEL